ncbi:hypothetical protein CYLTODRAFT_349929 [Cylindrobasidium torrendii FP15055 ss-10]|uniref:Uncharacterized protein n=1 Tax=Cylindrobasidium torrendii FP15055 ss-10 TaxID=1314674 RepID=A0A0D7BGD3_9AGAR|nr:hypothetical protein CYLTODRAFT_349929 [Cylindrobasidium torrendii FP15055 ss-10]
MSADAVQKPTTPPTSAKGKGHKRPFSIDLSLELEHQLEMEDAPTSPTAGNGILPNPDTLDPQILSHIVVQLRQSMSDLTKERDDLVLLLSKSTSKEAELSDALQHMTEAATVLEEKYSAAKQKMHDDAESISMLRSKVDESRRGLMRLQSESRRQSAAPSALDLSRAGSIFSSPPSSKRASFTPLTGSYAGSARPSHGHRRISSEFSLDSSDPAGQTFLIHDTPTKASRRQSSIFNRTPQSLDGERDPMSIEFDRQRQELVAVKDELDETRSELAEVKEAKEASDSCVIALREFIATNNVGVDSPGMPSPSAEVKKHFAGSSGWGFNKLWKVDTSVRSPSVDADPTPTNQMPASAVPFTRKIGGFFGSRGGSVSSIMSSDSLSPMQSNAALQRQSVYSGSDVSSLAEPVSPTGGEESHVTIRTSSDDNSVAGSPQVTGKGIEQLPVVPQGVAA